MTAEDVMTREVTLCLAADDVRDAASLMDAEDHGSLFVVAEDGSGRIEGVLTDRDVCLAAARRPEGLAGVQVRAVMSAPARVCGSTDALPRVLEIMEATGLRRLPVVDAKSRVVGAITLSDIAQVAADPGRSSVSSGDVCRVLVTAARSKPKPAHLLLG